MAVKIRFSRIGKKNSPVYRIVATDERNKRDGKCLDYLGTYHPLTGKVESFNNERFHYWLSVGAIPTDAVKKVQKKHLTPISL